MTSIISPCPFLAGAIAVKWLQTPSFSWSLSKIRYERANWRRIRTFSTCGSYYRIKKGNDKRAYIAALRQAKFYPQRQAAAAADGALWLLQCTSCNARDELHSILCIAAAHALQHLQIWRERTAAMHEMNYTRWTAFLLVHWGGSCIVAAPQ